MTDSCRNKTKAVGYQNIACHQSQAPCLVPGPQTPLSTRQWEARAALIQRAVEAQSSCRHRSCGVAGQHSGPVALLGSRHTGCTVPRTQAAVTNPGVLCCLKEIIECLAGGVRRTHESVDSKDKLSAFQPLKGENIREGVRRQFVLAKRGEKNPETWLGARKILPAPTRTRLWVRNREALVWMSSSQQPGFGAGKLHVVLLGHSRRSAAHQWCLWRHWLISFHWMA